MPPSANSDWANCWLRRGIILCVIAALFSHGPAVADSGVSNDVLDKRRDSISQLPSSEKQELVRKYEAYRKLDNSERARLRGLHKDIEADPALKQVMQNYVEWLKDLDVTQREQLRQATTPEQKRNLVVQFRREQLKRKDDLWREMNPQQQDNKRPFLPPLPSENLKKVMTALETDAIKSSIISPATQEALTKSEGSQRYKQLMRAIAEYRHPKDGSVRQFDLPDATRMAMVEAISNHELKEKLKASGRFADQRQNTQRLIMMNLRQSTLELARHEFNGDQGEALKEAIFQGLSPDEQTRYSQMPPDGHDQFLMRRHFEDIFRSFSMAGDLQLGPQFGPGNPFPIRRPGEGRPPEGSRPPREPPPDGRRPPRD